MASESSFDIVSEIDRQELSNALDQVRREVAQRYDFKGLTIEIKEEADKLIIAVPDEYKYTALLEVIKTKLMRRDVSLKILGDEHKEPASGGTLRVTIKLVEGVEGEMAKLINKLIRDAFPKIKSTIQGPTIRVSSKSRDELQAVMKLLEANPQITVPLQFTNYR